MLSAWDEASLKSLSWHWGEVYDIAVSDGIWSAVPIGDPAGAITAGSAAELREAVRCDYAERAEAKRIPGAVTAGKAKARVIDPGQAKPVFPCWDARGYRGGLHRLA
jgi:hypothetical protein